MTKDTLPFSIDVEKYCLSALLQNPEMIPDYVPFVRGGAFYNEVHEIIFGSLKSLHSTVGTVEKVLLIQQVENMGLSFKDGINIGDYIQALYSLHGVNPESVGKYFRELNKYHLARISCKKCEDLSVKIRRSMNLPASEIISMVQSGIADCVTSHVEEDFKPRDIFTEAEAYIEGLGDEPEEDGIPIPFPLISKMYGNLLIGDLTVVAAPFGQGKSTFINCMARHAVEKSYAKVLFLDTEMETERVIRRSVAAESGVSEYFLRTGKWRFDEEMVKKTRGLWEKYSKQPGFYHLYAANKPTDEIISICRRWASQMRVEFGEDTKLLVVYDYLKLTGEKITDSWKAYQVMGEKCDALKHLCPEIGASGLTAIQTNASGDIAMSQEIGWFASNVYILMQKTPEMMSEHGKDFGTHTLKVRKTRNQGEDAPGFFNFVPVIQKNGSTKYETNYINLNFDNFSVEERGTYQDIVARSAAQISIDDSDVDDRNLF